MKITLEKNELMEFSVYIPDEYYKELIKMNSGVKHIFGYSKKQEDALEYLKWLIDDLKEKHQDIILESVKLTRSDVYGKSN